MKKTLLFGILILMACPIWLKSQTYVSFPTANAGWNVLDVTVNDSNSVTDTTIIHYTLNGDTTLNSVQYHKMYQKFGETGTSYYIGGIREENKKIYFRHQEDTSDTAEALIYNFNAQVGDTVKSRIGYIVTGIDSIKINNSYRKRYIVNCDSAIDYIIEGIGSVKRGILVEFIAQPTCLCTSSTYEHICFKQNDTLVYLNPNFSDCNATKYITGIKATTANKQFSIYPNPTQKQLYIENNSGLENLQIKIYDLSGRLITTAPLKSTFDLTTVAGVYNLQITDAKGNTIYTEKIIKQ